MLLHHVGVWAVTSWREDIPPLALLDRWDSMLYSIIVAEGYQWPLWVYFPLYPGLVWLVRAALGGGLPPQVVGCGVSTLLLLAFVAWNTRWSRQGVLPPPLSPRTPWGWFLLLYGPASFSLHSHHTEALFLLLSFGALAFASRGALGPTVLLCMLCVWTRNQGCLVAITAALLLAGNASTWRERLLRFGTVGMGALLSFGGLLFFEWRMAGDPLAFMHAQTEWRYVDSVWGAIRGIWFGNPWHATGVPLWMKLRHGYAALWLVAALALGRRHRALGLYVLLSLLIMLPQGDLGNAFRYSTVLFPLLFLVGDWLAERPVWVRWTVAVLIVGLNQAVTHAYAVEVWAY
ncbi:hypothetical protein [Melittangium boletus]|uniref:hypothetical protein n=1 Tax=Melittangium boletus TaxID=83453 RepID=UPI003DA28B87